MFKNLSALLNDWKFRIHYVSQFWLVGGKNRTKRKQILPLK